MPKKYCGQVNFSKETLEELDNLKETLHAASRAEVVRNAIGVLKWVTKNLTDRNKIVVERKNNERAEVVFPFSLIQ